MWTHPDNCRVMGAGQTSLEAVIRCVIPVEETIAGANRQLSILSFAPLFFLRHQSSMIDQIRTIQHQLSATSTLQTIIFLASLSRYDTFVPFFLRLLTTIQMSTYARDGGDALAAIASQAHARIDSFARQYLELHPN